VSEQHEKTRISVKVNEVDRTFTIIVPWDQINLWDQDDYSDWLKEVEKVRSAWERKGYRST